MALADRQHAHLHRREPERERAGVVLDEDADEALEGSVERPVDDEHRMLGVVRPHIGKAEPLRHLPVELDRAELPGAAEHVGDVQVDLRPVEGAFAGAEHVLDLVALERRLERALGEVPLLVAAELVVRPRRELRPRLEPEEPVEEAEIVDAAVELRRDLLLRAEDVGVVLGDVADAREPVQRAGQLVAVQRRRLGVAQRQLAVAAQRSRRTGACGRGSSSA